MATTTANIGNNGKLQDKDLTELRQIASALSVDYEIETTAEELVKKINASGKFNPIAEKNGGTEDKDGKKVHPVFGEYIQVTVHPQNPMERETSIFVSVNSYVAEFQPDTAVWLPKQIVKFLKDSTYAKHVYDKNIVSDNGNVGAHVTKQVRSYIVEVEV